MGGRRSRGTGSAAYDRSFYQVIGSGSEQSARRILPFVVDLVRPASAVDVGCGDGSWLRVLGELGVGQVRGIDGPWALDGLKIDRASFTATELTRPLALDRTYDLALSLEVAEHLPADAAGGFVDALVGAAPVVLFSAAMPGQGGTGHLNEQWPDHWVSLFARHDYALLDVIRPRFWDDDEVEPWYAQNAFLFAGAPARAANDRLAAAAVERPPFPLRVVHPAVLARERAGCGVSVREELRTLRRAARRSLRARLRSTPGLHRRSAPPGA